MNVATRVACIGALGAWLCSAAVAGDSALDSVRAAIHKSSPDLPIQELRPAPLAGWYHAVLGGSSGYVSADGRYFIAGDLFDVPSRTNLSEQARNAARLDVLRTADLSQAIVFAPPKPQHMITVFTDVECGYCRKLHSEMARYHELGIAVRYLAYPRTGPGTESWRTMEAVWCSPDRPAALTRAKLGEALSRPASCAVDAVRQHYDLALKLGAPGTPMILLEDGRAVSGYMAPAQLAELLEQRSGAATARAVP